MCRSILLVMGKVPIRFSEVKLSSVTNFLPRVCNTQSEELEMQKNPLNEFQGCHENALIVSYEMSPHLMCLG